MPSMDESQMFFNNVVEILRPWETFDTHNSLTEAMRDAEAKFRITFLGEFSAGKSTLVNALAKENVCEVGVNPTTSEAQVVQVPWAPNVDIVDLPGINAGNFQDHEMVAMAEIEKANMVFLVLRAIQPITDKEIPIFKKMLTGMPEVAIVLNYWNVLRREGDKKDCLKRVRECARELLPTTEDVKIFCVDAATAMDHGEDNFDFGDLLRFVKDEAGKSQGALKAKKVDSLCSRGLEALQQIQDDQVALKERLEVEGKNDIQRLEKSLEASYNLVSVNEKQMQQELQAKQKRIDAEEVVFAQWRRLYDSKIAKAEGDVSEMESQLASTDSAEAGALEGLGKGALAGAAAGPLGALLGAVAGAVAGGAVQGNKRSGMEQQLNSKRDRLQDAKTEKTNGCNKHEGQLAAMRLELQEMQRREEKLRRQHEIKQKQINDDIKSKKQALQSQLQTIDRTIKKLAKDRDQISEIQALVMRSASSMWTRSRL